MLFRTVIRKISSLIAFLSFFIILLTSIILYIVPAGRIAYWANWRLWGIAKEQWSALHINMGFLFLISLGFHIYFNWKPIVSYLKNKTKKLKIFTKEFNVALILVLTFIFGSYFEIPPVSSIVKISDMIKDSGAKKYGEPPYGHAELSSLRTFTKRMELDLFKSKELLKKAGINVADDSQTLEEISIINKISPQKIYQTIKSAGLKSSLPPGDNIKMPENLPPGTGNLTLADLCTTYNLNIKIIERKLSEQNMKASAENTIKEIAEENNLSTIDLFEKIKNIALASERMNFKIQVTTKDK